MASVAFNEPTWAGFIVDEPTEVAGDVTVHHYSERLHYAAQNALLALEEEALAP